MSASAVVVGAGAALVAAGAVLAAATGAWRRALGLQALGMALVGAAGAAVLLGADPVGQGFRSDLTPALGIDRLSGFFLLVLGIAAVPAALAARDALTDAARGITALTGAFCLALVGLLAARDVITFLGFWELMTLLPATAILVARQDPAARRDVFTYLAITHVGGAGVWVSMLVLADHGALGGAPLDGGLRVVVAIAAILGFGTKAGAIPLHSWLPRAHPIAPAHLSALMSGVMTKLAIYGLIRVLFAWTTTPPVWVGLTLLGLGALSAVGGVLYALLAHELKRLLAFSTIENVGIVLLGLGASLVFAWLDEPRWSAIAFGAALLHVLNHAVFKALLFLGAGALARAVGSLDLDGLGGLLRRMPWTGGALLVGAGAIAGVPPLNGFASEWLTLQALVHVATEGPLGVAVAGALALAALGMTAALAAYCFVKVAGLVLLGAPRRPECAEAQDAPPATRGALAGLALLCVALGATPGLLVPRLAGLAPGPDADLASAPGLTVPGTGGLPALALVLALAGATLLLWRATRGAQAAPAGVWACGQDPHAPQLAWTSAGFTKPVRLVAESVLRPERELTVHAQGGVVQDVTFQADIPHLFDTLVLEPATTRAVRGAAIVRRLQTGSLRTYLLYLLGLVVVLLSVVRLGVLT